VSELFGASDRLCGVLEIAFEIADPHVEATTNVSVKFNQFASEFKVRVPGDVDVDLGRTLTLCASVALHSMTIRLSMDHPVGFVPICRTGCLVLRDWRCSHSRKAIQMDS
jgi:hypothetical protein